MELPVHKTPDSYGMKPQTVRFIKTDSTFRWIYAEGENGSGGWFQAGLTTIPELGLGFDEVFEKLNFVD